MPDGSSTGASRCCDERIRAGRVVDGHGDLLAEDVFCLDDGPRILDCLDFDDRLRWLDGLDDASFLAMDLERLGAPDLADRFTKWYMEYSADHGPAALRHHYVAYRAFVRAKVSCLHWDQGHHAAGNRRECSPGSRSTTCARARSRSSWSAGDLARGSPRSRVNSRTGSVSPC